MKPSKPNCCSAAPMLIFPCSGASDVGEITDRAARKLTRDGVGRMYCLAGIGGRVKEIVDSTQTASKILAIDGCTSDCARNTLEQAGFRNYEHLRLSDMGMEKGKSSVTDESIAKVVERGGGILNR